MAIEKGMDATSHNQQETHGNDEHDFIRSMAERLDNRNTNQEKPREESSSKLISGYAHENVHSNLTGPSTSISGDHLALAFLDSLAKKSPDDELQSLVTKVKNRYEALKSAHTGAATHTPEVQATHTPEVQATHTPEVQATHTPEIQATHTPEIQATHTPEIHNEISSKNDNNYNIRTKIDELKKTKKKLLQELNDVKKELKILEENSSSRFLKKITGFFKGLERWLKKPFTKPESLEKVNNAEPGDHSQSHETQNGHPTKFEMVKKVFNGIGEFLRKVAIYTGLLRWGRATAKRYRENPRKAVGVELGLLASNIVIGPLGQIIYHGSKMSEYNHKNEMHEKYHKDKKASKKLVYNEGGKTYTFSVPDGAKDRELAFLTRHPISNEEKKNMKKNKDYKAVKNDSNLTKAQVKQLRKNPGGEPINGWQVVINEDAAKETNNRPNQDGDST